MSKPSTINMTAVKSMYDHYHAKIKSNPTLYTNQRDGNNAVVVTLPVELLDWANRGAGHSGFAGNARPVGIRKNCNHAPSFLAKTFSSVDNLAEFIQSSECDADEYIAEVRERHARKQGINIAVNKTPVDPLDLPMSSYNMKALYGEEQRIAAMTKFSKTIVGDFKTLTRREFELRYNLVAQAA